jgi:cytochrome c2
VIRNGIKMTAMPAWQYRLTDAQIWQLVAFVKLLPSYSPADYQSAASHLANDRMTLINESAIAAGRADAGKRAIDQYLCATCHRIPGIVGAEKDVGPPLNGIAKRTYIAGVLDNNFANMVRWIEHPQKIKPGSAMPELGVRSQDANDIAAYLYTLK